MQLVSYVTLIPDETEAIPMKIYNQTSIDRLPAGILFDTDNTSMIMRRTPRST